MSITDLKIETLLEKVISDRPNVFPTTELLALAEKLQHDLYTFFVVMGKHCREGQTNIAGLIEQTNLFSSIADHCIESFGLVLGKNQKNNINGIVRILSHVTKLPPALVRDRVQESSLLCAACFTFIGNSLTRMILTAMIAGGTSDVLADGNLVVLLKECVYVIVSFVFCFDLNILTMVTPLGVPIQIEVMRTAVFHIADVLKRSEFRNPQLVESISNAFISAITVSPQNLITLADWAGKIRNICKSEKEVVYMHMQTQQAINFAILCFDQEVMLDQTSVQQGGGRPLKGSVLAAFASEQLNRTERQKSFFPNPGYHGLDPNHPKFNDLGNPQQPGPDMTYYGGGMQYGNTMPYGQVMAPSPYMQAPVYGAQPAPIYGAQPAPVYGAQPAPIYGAQPAPIYGAQPAPAPLYGNPMYNQPMGQMMPGYPSPYMGWGVGTGYR